jgi:hypothetical protein
MSNNKKKPHNKKENDVLISSKEIEQFKIMLDNFGNDLNILNTNYQELLECN